MRRSTRRMLATVAGLLLDVSALSAQGVTGGAILGRVLAADSTPLSGAIVSATNLSNGARWQAATGGAGGYLLEHLSVGGPYRIQVQAIGYRPVRREPVSLSLGQRLRLDFTLHPGAQVLDSLTVSADPLIGPGRTGPAHVISDSTIARLPLDRRDLLAVARLSPLVTANGSVAGQNQRLTAVQVDGAAAGDLLGGGLATPGQVFGLRTLPAEAVREVQVLAAPFDVRYGSFAGGVVNVVTKSGANHPEGTLSGYYTGDGLQGQDDLGSRGEEFSTSELTATLGGPLVRDRLAIFVNGGFRRTQFPLATPVIGTDTTGGADSLESGFRRASVTRLQQVMQDTYGVEAGGTDPYPLDVPGGNLFGKLTLQLGVNSRLELSHEYSRSTPDLLPIACRVRDQFFCLGSTALQLPTRSHITRLEWVAAPGARWSNQLLLARSWFRQSCQTTDFPLVFVGADGGELGAGGTSLCVDDLREQQVGELTDNLTLSAGAHRLTLGAHVERIRLRTHENLAFGFGPSWHFRTADSLAAGQPYKYEGILEHPARAGAPLSDLGTDLISPYVQDQWSVTPRLLVTIGLRADLPRVTEAPTRNPALAEAFSIDNSRTPGGHLIVTPRLGLSYDLAGDGSTFLRGGIGLFAGRPDYRWLNEVYTHTGLEAIQVSCDSTNVPPFTTDVHRQPVACAGGDGAGVVAGPVSAFDPEFRYPTSLKVSAGVDHRLPGGFVGTLDLLFTRAVHQFHVRELNLQPPSSTAFGEARRPLYGGFLEDGTAVPSRHNDAFGRVVQVGNADGDRSFALTAQLQRRFADGRELSLAYTYTSARDLLSATEDGLDANLDVVPVNGSLEHRRLAVASWSVPHRISLLVAANLPVHFRLAVTYEASSGEPFTYIVQNDANADGYANDAVYVPNRSAPDGDLRLVVEDAEGRLVAAPAETYAELEALIQREGCLRAQRGQGLRRNSCRNPWMSRANARLSRMFAVPGGRALELGFDVFNVLHLLRSGWGVTRRVSDPSLLRLAGYDTDEGRGVYQFLQPQPGEADYADSRWHLQLGARAMF